MNSNSFDLIQLHKSLREVDLPTMDNLKIGPWRSYDPRDGDWQCSYCERECPNGPKNCPACQRPRLLTQEEKEDIRKSEQSGEEFYEKVMTGEYIVINMENIDRTVEAFRQWYRMPTQVVSFDKVSYIFVAVKSAKQEDRVNYYFIPQWREAKEYTFPEPKPLDEITKEICDIIREKI